MNPDLMRQYLAGRRTSRRAALRIAGAAGVLGASAVAGVPTASAAGAPAPAGPGKPGDRFDDALFDYSDPANLADWAPSRYGADDQRGALNEVTPEKTAAALGLVRSGAVRTYNLGELMYNGFPAAGSGIRRSYEQRLTVSGYQPPQGFQDEGGVLFTTDPLGTNKLSYHEERFAGEVFPNHSEPLSTTFQIGSQLDNLNHIGSGDFFYNGLRGPDVARGHGTAKLGSENVGPVVTRGVLLDVLGVKLAKGQVGDLAEPASNGEPLLRENYRITVADLVEAMDFGRIKAIEPGDAVLLRTGWHQLLVRRDPGDVARWQAPHGMPGIYVREARWLSQFRPAIIGSDTWALEVLGSPVNEDGAIFPVHQELMMRHGIRIGESYVLDDLAEDGVHEFVFAVTPQFSEGATAGNTTPLALAQRR
ncbi:cyclase family protein [Saccharopolyspora sp. WRP15-2]|uniref:Cyclase family protein n=1 Tax=Saccharopolyspora oryzae TaxID=2997343 RepID=A0ABT4UQK6_9PSEU|nr:cyclase family protein [Saccharopolyspora oryzae]MDA3624008.1 cyclase family protein [Saccharopolyspora oryzae]